LLASFKSIFASKKQEKTQTPAECDKKSIAAQMDEKKEFTHTLNQ